MVRFVFLLIAAVLSNAALACSPPEVPPPETTLQEAQLLFRGRVTKIEYVEPTGRLKTEMELSPLGEDMPWAPMGLLKIYAEPLTVLKGRPSVDTPVLMFALAPFLCHSAWPFAGFEILFVVRPIEAYEEYEAFRDDFPKGTAGLVDQTSAIFLDDPKVHERFRQLEKLAASRPQ